MEERREKVSKSVVTEIIKKYHYQNLSNSAKLDVNRNSSLKLNILCFQRKRLQVYKRRHQFQSTYEQAHVLQ